MIAHVVVERTRDYTSDALKELFHAMDGIERKYDLIVKLTEEEKAAVAAEDKLDRGEKLAELELAGPIEDFLPESETSILARLTALPENDRDAIFGMISLLIDIDKLPAELSPTQVAEVRRRARDRK